MGKVVYQLMEWPFGSQKKDKNLVTNGIYLIFIGPIFGNQDYFNGLGIIFDTYNNDHSSSVFLLCLFIRIHFL